MSVRGYIELALVVLILMLVIVALWFWRLKDNSQANLIAAQAVHTTDVAIHKDDQNTIARITAFRSADDAVISKFTDEVAAVNDRFSNIETNINNLRRTNADVEKYL